MKLSKSIKILFKILPIFVGVLLIFHLFAIDFLVIDNITIFLILLITILLFAPNIKKLKWGDFEAEIERDEVDNIIDKAEKVIPPETETEQMRREPKQVQELYSLFEQSPVAALAKLRIEIEIRLTRLYKGRILKTKKIPSINQMVRELSSKNIISSGIKNLILDTKGILNRVVHGEQISNDKAEEVLEMGIDLIKLLDDKYYEKILSPIEVSEVTKQELENLMESKYEIITVVPLVDGPHKNKRIVTQEELDNLLDGYDEYAEFLISIKKLD